MQESCLACGYRITYPLYDPPPRPLAALNLPRSAEAAPEALRFPMDYRVCAYCGHIFNAQFDYYQVPYEDNSKLMYNRGPLWKDHLERLVEMLVTEYDAAGKTLVDVGCGDGLFLKLLIQRDLDCRCIGFEVLQLRSCYGDEVAVAVVRAKKLSRLKSLRESTDAFRRRIQTQRAQVSEQVKALREQRKSVAFWGGTGKGAAFLNAFDIHAEAFSLVVDSDAHKVGRYVPGTAQQIRPPEYLKQNPVDVIVITTRWRAKDIFAEIRGLGIPHETVLVLEAEQLQPYRGEE